MRGILIVFFLSSFMHVSMAQSPLRDAAFASAYADLEIVDDLLKLQAKGSREQFVLSEKQLLFLDNANKPLDERMALANAVGCGQKNIARQYENHLLKKYKLPQVAVDSMLRPLEYPGEPFYSLAVKVSYQDLCLLGYLESLAYCEEDPFRGYRAVYEALHREPSSSTVNFIAAIMRAANLADWDPCQVSGAVISVRDEVVMEKDFMRADAIDRMISSVRIYDEICRQQSIADMESTGEKSVDGPLPFTPEYWKANPVYKKPDQQQVSEKKMKIDLELMNEAKGEDGLLDNWIFYNESTAGTRMVVTVRNNGNVQSIPTNLLIDVDNTSDLEMGIHLFIQHPIPALEPGQRTDLIVEMPGYWVYDPDADFTILIDADNNIIETNESNNKRRFFENG